MVQCRDKVLLERMVAAAAAAAPGNATNTVVIRGRKVSRREVQQEMRWWQWAYGDKKASLLLCPLGIQWETTNKSCAQFRQSYKFGLVWTKPPVNSAFDSFHSCGVYVSRHTAMTAANKGLVFFKARFVVIKAVSLSL